MNLKTTYENLIAEKVQQLPIPDMADAIWASIELQLDADITGDGENNSPSQKPSGKDGNGFGYKSYFLIAAAIIIAGLVWLIARKKGNASSDKKLPDTTIARPPSIVTDSGAKRIFITQEEKKENSLPVVIPKNNKQSGSIDSIKTTVDSLNNIPTVILPFKDTASAKIFPKADSLLVTPIIKKPKGVKGISNADYKIASDRKDSLKKKD